MATEGTSALASETLASMVEFYGFKLAREQLDDLLTLVQQQAEEAAKLRALPVDKAVEPDVVFQPADE